MISSFQLTEYHIDKLLLFNPNREVDGHEIKHDYFANYRVDSNDSHWSGAIALGFRSSYTDEQKRIDLDEIIIIGQFTMEKNDMCQTQEDFIKRLKINGSSTLIPIARAVLQTSASMTQRAEYHKLPNINVYDLNWNAQIE